MMLMLNNLSKKLDCCCCNFKLEMRNSVTWYKNVTYFSVVNLNHIYPLIEFPLTQYTADH